MASDLSVTAVERRAHLVELEAEWASLLEQTDVASPFLTLDWQLAWLDTYGVMHRPFVLVARKGGELVGLWPLALRRRGPFRVLEPIGAGRSDWLDIPVRTDSRAAVLAAFCRLLAEERPRWDLLDLRDVLAESPTIPTLAACVAQGPLRLRRQSRTVAPYLAIQGNWDSYLGSRSANFRSSLRRRMRKAREATGGLAVARLAACEAGGAIELLGEVERRSWKAREGTRKLTTTTGREFYRRFCTAFAARGLLQVWTATLQGTTVGYLVLFVHGGKCYYYNGAYAEEVAELSPGTLLHAAAIEDAFGAGLREYDFLSGDEPYKDRWSTHKREIHHLALYSGRLASLAAFATLVAARWALRNSRTLRRGRAWLISVSRRLLREGTPR